MNERERVRQAMDVLVALKQAGRITESEWAAVMVALAERYRELTDKERAA